MNKKVEITVDYFKQSGKWYTEESYSIDVPRVVSPRETYDLRKELESIISNAFTGKEFIAVVRYTKEVEDILGFPMMIK